MSNYGWTNEEGEPIMSGEAWRFEQQLDMDSQADYYADHFYDDGYYDEPDEDRYDECPSCKGEFSFDTQTSACDDCGFEDSDDGYVAEDQFLDSYMEDRISTMYEG
jgi:hypothetical protein